MTLHAKWENIGREQGDFAEMTIWVGITDALVMRELKHFGEITRRLASENAVIMEVSENIDLDEIRRAEGVNKVKIVRRT